MVENPDPKKYVIRMRKGKPVLVDRQIIRWRKRQKALAPKTSKPAKTDPTKLKFFE